MKGENELPRLEVTRREVNLSLLSAAFAAVAGLPASVRAAPSHLFDFAIAGGYHYELRKELPDLRPGTRLSLIRESKNPYDANAVAVHTQAGAKLGFIPRCANTPIAQLLDAGREVYAEVQGLVEFSRSRDVPKELVFTNVASGDPVIRLTTFHPQENENAT